LNRFITKQNRSPITLPVTNTAAYQSGRTDLNRGPLEPHSSALPDCATPRLRFFMPTLSLMSTAIIAHIMYLVKRILPTNGIAPCGSQRCTQEAMLQPQASRDLRAGLRASPLSSPALAPADDEPDDDGQRNDEWQEDDRQPDDQVAQEAQDD
jgi:hypothetical protein